MSDTIRERIIAAIMDRAAIIRTDNGFNTDCGANVFRAARKIDPSQLDAVTVFPRRDTATGEFGSLAVTMPVDVQGLAEIGTVETETEGERAERVSQLIESMLGDLIEMMTGDRWSIAFTSGSREPVAGDTFTGATSDATGVVESVTVSSGSWAAGNAAGSIKFRRRVGTFAAENIDIGSESNVATVGETVTRESAIELVTDSLADGIYYQGGGVDDYQEGGDQTVGVSAAFNITFPVLAGNPYGQP
jgi:hypothetical protein